MLPRPDVRAAHVDDGIAVGFGLAPEHVGLPSRKLHLRAQREPAVGDVEFHRASERRNPRQRFIVRCQPRVHVPDAEGQPGPSGESGAGLGVESGEAAVALQDVEHRQVVDDRIPAAAEDEVVDLVREEVQVATGADSPVPQAHVQSDGGLGVEVRVADVEGERAGVGAEVVQLLDGRGAVGARQVGHQRVPGAEIRVDSDRRRDTREAAVAHVGRLGSRRLLLMPVLLVSMLLVPVFLVPVLLFVPGSTAARRHGVVIAVDPGAELHSKPPEGQFFVGEGREGTQVGPRRQRLGSRRLEVPHLRPGAESPRETIRLPLVHVGPEDVDLVVVARADALLSGFGLQLVMSPVHDAQAEPSALDDTVVEVPESEVEAPGAALPVEFDIGRAMHFLLVLAFVLAFVLVFVCAVFVSVVIVVHVELADDRYSVAAVVHRDAGAGEEPVAGPAQPGLRVGRLGRGVLDDPRGRVVVLRPPRAAGGPVVDSVLLRVLHADVPARLRVRAPQVGAQQRPRAFRRRCAVALLGRDHVDEPADRVRAVQQCRRPADDLDAFHAVGVDGDAMVAGLARQVSGADAVLQDHDPVAVEAADDRPVRSGTEAAHRDAGLVPQGVGEIRGRLLGDIERVHGGDRVECLERGLGAVHRGGHRHVLANG